MILTCPSCGTQYVVKDGAIPPEGRQVRCAACKHSWHQDPEQPGAAPPVTETGPEEQAEPDTQTISASEPVPVTGESEEAPAEEESFAEATMIDPRSGPEAEERAYEEAVIEEDGDIEPAVEPVSVAATDRAEPVETVPGGEDWREPPHAEDAPEVFSPFAGDEAPPRGRSPLLTIVILVLVVVAAAAAFWFFAPPDLKARLGLATAGASPLALVITHRDRQPLESGNELLTVTGRVINPSAKDQDVPPLQAQLKNKAGKVVYSWTIAPPARTLPAGGSASFNSAEVNVPPGGDYLTITVGAPRA
jgi:predicted Zn finger-like uncharacterized protein/flagellin-like protein